MAQLLLSLLGEGWFMALLGGIVGLALALLTFFGVFKTVTPPVDGGSTDLP